MPDIGNISTGEANTASNVGSGADIFKQKSGVDLQFIGINAASSKVSAVVNGDNVDVDTPNAAQINTANVWGDFANEFHDNSIFLWNPARTFKYNLTAQAITADVTTQLPNVGGGTHTLMVRNGNDALQNKEIDMSRFFNADGNVIFGTGADNPYLQINDLNTGATVRRSGLFTAECSNCGIGQFQGSDTTVIGTNTNILNSTEGRYQQYATGAVNGNNAGIRQTSTHFRREWFSYMCGRIRLSTLTNVRAFFGWTSSASEVVIETSLDNLEGCGLVKRVGDTNWQVVTNDGDTTSNYADTGVAVLNNSFALLQVQIDPTNFRSMIGGTENTAVTTELPASATNLFTHWEIETASATDISIGIAPIFARTGDAL